MIYIGSSMTAGYRPRAEPYFASLAEALDPSACQFFFIGLDFNPFRIFSEYGLEGYVESYYLATNKLHDPSNTIIQHGDFLNINKQWKDDDYVLWTDCDAFFQRPLDSLDRQHFQKTQFCCGVLPNKGEDCLSCEFARIGGQGDAKEAIEQLGFDPRLALLPTLNTGCVGATVNSWALMQEEYNKRSQEIKSIASHYARQQFLMSLIVYSTRGLSLMPKYTHCDGHYNLPEDIVERDGTFIYENGTISVPAYFCHGGQAMKYAYK